MKKLFKSIVLSGLSILAAGGLSGCVDDQLKYGDQGLPYNGEVSLQLDFEFEGMGDALNTKALPGDLDFQINRLTIFMYPENGDEDTTEPVYVYDFTDNSKFDVYVLENREDHHCEEQTYHGKVTLEGIEGGSYRIYGVANVDFEDLYISEKQLREIKIQWPSEGTNQGGQRNPGRYGVPDAMFGYFTIDGVTDHSNKNYRNVIHHNPSLYDKTSDSNDVLKKGEDNKNRAPAITLSSQTVRMQAWLKRVVSKLTIGFDGSKLNPGIDIYIKSVAIKDAAKECFLGHDNSAGQKNDLREQLPIGLISPEDDRCNLVYDESVGAEGISINSEKTAFPRQKDDDVVSSDSWKAFIHGSLENPNPKYNLKPTTLYFFENLQGVEEGSPKTASNKDTGGNYIKDIPDGTYVEVKGYYVNSNIGEKSQGNITYRFMLGKNITNDYNVERNFHYKLVLSFIGDANNPDWHIDYEEENSFYFPIPNESQWGESNVWNAYNNDGEPIAQIARELVYYNPETELDVTKETTFSNGKPRPDLIYYQIVSVYPVKKDDFNNYLVDMAEGMVAQVKKRADRSSLGDDDLKAGGNISILLRTQGEPYLANNNKVNVAKCANYAIRSLTDGKHENYDYVEVLSTDFDIQIKGKVTLNLTWTGKGSNKPNDFKWNYGEEKDTENGKKCNLKLGDQKRDILRIKPYKIQDADGNSYGVTKIGASYWAQEYLKTEHYFNVGSDGLSTMGGGPPIYPYAPNSKTQQYTHDKDGEWEDYILETIEGTEGGYDYDFGAVEDNKGYVHFYERYPMFKTFKGIKMYNFFAVTGTRGQIGSNGKEEFFKNSTGFYKGKVNPIYSLPVSTCIVEQKLGYIDPKYYNSSERLEEGVTKVVELNTEKLDLWVLSGDEYNHPLAPFGWHALPTEDTYAPDEFGAQISDHDYLEEFSNFDWEHYFTPDMFGEWQWPIYPGSNIIYRNLSGLSLLPIPSDWETNKNFVTFDAVESGSNAGLYEGSLHGVAIGFWGNSIGDEYVGIDGANNNAFIMGEGYANSGYINIDKNNWLCRTIYSRNFTYLYELNKTYQPIRMVRNAWDYSVEKIGRAN